MAVKKTVGIGKGTPGPGRPKGVPNKTTTIAKEAIAQAADRLGGVDRLVAWSKEDALNERAFWSSIYPKLLPLQVAGDPDNPLQMVHTITRRFVHVK
jgi:hypothetical protein